MSSDRLGISEPRPAEEVIQSLKVRVLHRHLGLFGITEVSTEVCARDCASPLGLMRLFNELRLPTRQV